MALTIDGVELEGSWSESQAANPLAVQPAVVEQDGELRVVKLEGPSATPAFGGMRKAEIVEYLSPNGNYKDTTLTKAELIKIAEELHAQKG
jgi:hypothetical protein